MVHAIAEIMKSSHGEVELDPPNFVHANRHSTVLPRVRPESDIPQPLLALASTVVCADSLDVRRRAADRGPTSSWKLPGVDAVEVVEETPVQGRDVFLCAGRVILVRSTGGILGLLLRRPTARACHLPSSPCEAGWPSQVLERALSMAPSNRCGEKSDEAKHRCGATAALLRCCIALSLRTVCRMLTDQDPWLIGRRHLVCLD
mmetsp:Transcript_6614/g.24658  ORF Transcript_6614/g.24658 Transcript_6614/m.24658 type:complete len:203 (-) Transcript_6614:115-723(-)